MPQGTRIWQKWVRRWLYQADLSPLLAHNYKFMVLISVWTRPFRVIQDLVCVVWVFLCQERHARDFICQVVVFFSAPVWPEKQWDFITVWSGRNTTNFLDKLCSHLIWIKKILCYNCLGIETYIYMYIYIWMNIHEQISAVGSSGLNARRRS